MILSSTNFVSVLKLVIMIRKFLVAFFILFVLVAAGVGLFYYVSKTSNPWNAATVGDIPAPLGYERVDVEKGSYAEYLRRLPLKERGNQVMLFTGGKAKYQYLSTAVIDKQLLSNFEQCADVTMRLRAEYLWEQGLYHQISFKDVNGKRQPYQGGASRNAFEKYMRRIYGICSTYSLYHETKKRKITEVQAGDVFVYPARPGRKYGHAVIVVDVAKSKSGKIAVMCAEGNTPARSMHIARNLNPLENPWFFFDESDDVFWIGPFHFYKDELRYY